MMHNESSQPTPVGRQAVSGRASPGVVALCGRQNKQLAWWPVSHEVWPRA